MVVLLIYLLGVCSLQHDSSGSRNGISSAAYELLPLSSRTWLAGGSRILPLLFPQSLTVPVIPHGDSPHSLSDLFHLFRVSFRRPLHACFRGAQSSHVAQIRPASSECLGAATYSIGYQLAISEVIICVMRSSSFLFARPHRHFYRLQDRRYESFRLTCRLRPLRQP